MSRSLLSILLSPAAAIYRMATVIDRRIKQSNLYKSTLPVVSIGNISVGGSGKTQIIIALLRELQTERPVIVLSRGYGRKDREPRIWRPGSESPDPALLGDEPAMVASELTNGAIAVGADRVSLLRSLEQELPDAIVLLDDGFQHHRLSRNLDLVIVDAGTAEQTQMLPAGRLREHPSALRRADLVLCDGEAAVEFASRWAPQTPTVMIRQKVNDIVSFLSPGAALPEGSPFLVTGIARPERVQRSLETLGVTPAGYRKFDDHHRYSGADIRSILQELRTSGAHWIVTTRKDAVKLVGFPEVRELLYVLDVEMIVDDMQPLIDRIQRL